MVMSSWIGSKPPRRLSVMRAATLVSVILLASGGAACGGGKSKSTTSRSATSTSTTTSSKPAGGTSSVSTGPIHGTLVGQSHAPKVKQAWRYSLKVTDATGRPLSGTVDIEFVFAGQVVGRDTPPSHPVTDGRWHDTIEFPARAVGFALTFRAVVHTRLGSVILDWPVKVRQ
jgi:hypothetical protein